MKKYIIDNVEYTLEQVESAARDNGVDIDTYINDMGAQVVDSTQTEPDPVEKSTAPAETTAAVGAMNENTGSQLESGSSVSKDNLTKKDFQVNNLGNILFGYDEVNEVNADGGEFTYSVKEKEVDDSAEKQKEYIWNNASEQDIIDQPWYRVLRHHEDFADKTLIAGLVDLYSRRQQIKENKKKAALGSEELKQQGIINFARENGINNLDVAEEQFMRQVNFENDDVVIVDVPLDIDDKKTKITEADYDEAAKLKADLTVSQANKNAAKNILVDLERNFPYAGEAVVGAVTKYLGSDIVPKSITEDLAVWSTELEKERMFNPTFQLTEALEGKRDKDGKLVAGSAILSAGLNLATTMIPAALTRGRSLAPQIALPMISEYNKNQAEAQGMSKEEYIQEGKIDIATPLIYSLPAIALEKIGYKGITQAIIKAAGKNTAAATTAKALSSMGTEAWTEWLQTGIETFSSTKGAGGTDEEAATLAAENLFSREGLESALQGAVGSGVTIGVGGVGKSTLKALSSLRAGVDVEGIESDVNEIEALRIKKIEATDKDVQEGIEQQIQEIKERLKFRVTKSNGILNGLTEKEIDEVASMGDLAALQQKRVLDIKNKLDNGEITEDQFNSAYEGFKASYIKAKNRIKGIVGEAEGRTPEDVSARTVKNANAINNGFNSNTMQRTNEQTGKTELTDKGLEFFHNTLVPSMSDLVTRIANSNFRQNKEFGESKYKKEDFIADLLYAPDKNRASSLIGLLASFKPEKDQFLTTYITNQLEKRSRRILQERVGSQATIGGTSIDTQEASQIQAEDTQVPAMQGPKFTKRLGLSDDIMNKARKAAAKALATAKNVDSKTFTTDIVNSINNEIFDDIRKIIPKPKEREAFMEQFAGAIWDAIPSSSLAKATRNQTFQSWNLNAPTKKAFVDYFLGRDQEGLAANTINDRARKQLPEYLAKAIGAEYAQDLLENDSEVRERFRLSQEQEFENAANEIQNKTKEQQELEKNNPEELEKLKQLAGEGDAGSINKILDTNKITVDNSSSENNYEKLTKRQEGMLNFVKTAKIPSWLLKKAGFANFGAEYTKKNGVKYYKLKNGKEVAEKTLEFKKAQEQNLILPSRGGLFSSVNSAFYKQALEIAKENNKLYPNLSSKRIVIPKQTRINTAFLKKNAQQIKQNMDFLITSMKVLSDAVHKYNLPIEDAFLFITSSYQATSGFIKVAAPFKYISKAFAYGTVPKQMQSEMYREEHQPPSSYIGKIMMWAIKYNKADLIEPFIRKNYYQTQLSKADDQKIDEAKLDKGMPKDYLIFEDPIIRMAKAGVNLNDQFNIQTGKTMAQEFDAKSIETPDAIAASNEVVKEKLEDNFEVLINRAIGKLEDYLGPKGALQANFAAVPINILVGGLRATKLAYRGSKNLTTALQEGYKKVKNYMSQREWLEFTKKAVSGVRTGPDGKTVALAIANENAIKNEQVRKTKLDILKKAGVYSKEDDNKTSQELNEKLKEKDNAIKSSNRTEGLERNFRKILNTKKDKGGRPSKWFIPPNAEDIKGLLYAFLPKGKAGVEAKKFFNSAILKPYSDGIAAAEAEILQKAKLFKQLEKDSGVDLNENIKGTPYTLGDAIKVYNWDKQGIEVDILKDEYLDQLIGAVELNPKAKYMAEQVANNYEITYDKNWRNIPFNKSIFDAINSGTRGKSLEIFSQNVDAIFNKDNLKEIENVFGKKYVQALSNTLKRMKTGRNRISTDAQSNAYMNFINRSVATTMFFNTRSAGLQLLSALNYIGQENNNIFQATAAFANQAQWQQDYNKLWNSDYLTNRRKGAKFDVLADEIAEGDPKGLNKLLKAGFLPTRYADSFAIALGGAAFYRNRVNALMKKGMSQQEAEEQGMKDWVKSSEDSQQSSDPSKISEIQASGVGKIIYAFANTPFQYARIVKRKLQDITSGRSFAEGGMNQVRKDIQTSLYYTAGQALLFNALQSGLIAALMGGNDDEEELEEKTILAAERALTSFAKSTGNPGAIIASIYSMIDEADSQIEKKGRIDNPYKIALEATGISPPVNAKLNDIVAIGNIYKYNHKQIEKDPFELSINNPTLEIAGNAASFAGVPLDRVIRKTQNLNAAINEELDAWTRLWLVAGWSKWELGVDDKQSGSKPKPKAKAKPKPKPKPKPKSAVKKLKNGVAGQANRDGSIEIDPNLSPVEKAKTVAHEKQHVKDMKSGILDYDDSFVYWKNKKFKRKSGKILYNGKYHIEGDPKLPWEKRAYDAEPTTKQAKKLYA